MDGLEMSPQKYKILHDRVDGRAAFRLRSMAAEMRRGAPTESDEEMDL
jgi:hypothetical protein